MQYTTILLLNTCTQLYKKTRHLSYDKKNKSIKHHQIQFSPSLTDHYDSHNHPHNTNNLKEKKHKNIDIIKNLINKYLGDNWFLCFICDCICCICPLSTSVSSRPIQLLVDRFERVVRTIARILLGRDRSVHFVVLQ